MMQPTFRNMAFPSPVLVSLPKIWACPSVGFTSPNSIFIIVVLPAPFLPNSPYISPFFTEKETECTTVISLYFFVTLLISITFIT